MPDRPALLRVLEITAATVGRGTEHILPLAECLLAWSRNRCGTAHAVEPLRIRRHAVRSTTSALMLATPALRRLGPPSA
jgi:hypothetical protein